MPISPPPSAAASVPDGIEALPEVEDIQPHPRSGRVVFGVVVACTLLVGMIWADAHPVVARAWVRGQYDLAGEAQFHAAHPIRTANISWREVHASLLPGWMMARAQASESGRGSQQRRRVERAQRAFTRLRYALGADQNMVEILDELDERLTTAPIAEAARIDYLLWAYNDYLDRNHVPWRVEATMQLREGRPPAFYTRSYEILSDLRSSSGRLRLMRRVDLTNIESGFLGHTTGHDEGALVIMNEVVHFAVHQIWPLLNAGLDDRLPAETRGLAPFVRAEAAARLAPGYLQILQTTAEDELALIEVAASIHARASCGNGFRIRGLPWNGLAPPDQRALVNALTRSRDDECPEVTLSEAARMIGASQRLGHTKDLADSVEALAAWVASGVSVHELRHVADHESTSPMVCSGCPEGTGRATQDELSAYLASFAAPGRGYLALTQACALESQMSASASSHAQALALALPQLLDGSCSGEVPVDLYARARALEQRYFGARPPIVLPPEFPARLRLLPR